MLDADFVAAYLTQNPNVRTPEEAAEALGVEPSVAQSLLRAAMRSFFFGLIEAGQKKVLREIASGAPVAMEAGGIWFYANDAQLHLPLEIFGKRVVYVAPFQTQAKE